MSSTAALQILLSAKDEASAVLEQTSGKLGKLGGAAKGAFGIIGGAAGGAAVGILSDMARAAAADEVGMVALKTAVENTGVSWEDNSAAIEERIKKGQALAFSDDDVRASIAQLTTATGDAGKALDMQGLVMDIARGRNISLGAATDIAQKAALGQFGALKKIGIVLAEGSTATEALGALQERYAKQADNYGGTTQAALFKVNDAIGEWKESIGAATGPAMGFIAMLPGLSSGMMMAGGSIGGVSKALGIQRVGMALTIPVAGGLTIAMGPLILVAGAVAVAVGLLAIAWSNNLGDIQGKTEAVLGVVTGLWDTFSSFFRGLWEGLGGPVSAALAVITAPIRGLIELAQRAIGWLQNLGVARPSTNVSANHASGGNYLGGAGVDSYATGTSFVPQTGLALLHRGEAVVPASENRGRGRGGDVHIHFDGPVYGMTDFSDKVRWIVGDAFRRGEYRGMVPRD